MCAILWAGDTIRRKGLTWRATGALVGRWSRRRGTYRHPARVSETLRRGSKGCPSACATSPGRRRSISSPQRQGQEAACRHGCDRPRDGRLPGDRTGGRARVASNLSLPMRRPGSGARKWGTPAARYVAEPCARRCPLDRGKPRDEDTEGGNQPADKSLINRRLKLRSQLCAVSAYSCRRLSRRTERSTASECLTANIRANSPCRYCPRKRARTRSSRRPQPRKPW
jgi:hypothetical protein